MSVEDEVRRPSERFYAALNGVLNGDLGPMNEVWSHGEEVTTMHPPGGREEGWEQVGASWERFSEIISGGQLTVSDLLVRVGGDLAYTVCIEHPEVTLGIGRSALTVGPPTSTAGKMGSGRWSTTTSTFRHRYKKL